MKIIVSPSKTQSDKVKFDMTFGKPVFASKTNELVDLIRNLSKEELGRLMKIDGEILNRVFLQYKNYEVAKINHAITSYTGLVFKALNLADYNKIQLEYLQKNVVILSALNGVLNPFDGIKPYRLDMTMKPCGVNLYKFWDFDSYCSEEVVINLASNEFSKLVTRNKVDVLFLEYKNDKYVNIATYSKQARGLMLDYMIKNNIRLIDDIKEFNLNGYKYSERESSVSSLVFVR